MGLSHLATINIAISRTNNQPNFSDVESMWDVDVEIATTWGKTWGYTLQCTPNKYIVHSFNCGKLLFDPPPQGVHSAEHNPKG